MPLLPGLRAVLKLEPCTLSIKPVMNEPAVHTLPLGWGQCPALGVGVRCPALGAGDQRPALGMGAATCSEGGGRRPGGGGLASCSGGRGWRSCLGVGGRSALGVGAGVLWGWGRRPALGDFLESSQVGRRPGRG